MEVYINSEKKSFNDPLTIEQLVRKQFENNLPKGIAIAVDNQVVPRNNWKDFKLSTGNKIIIITATQGG
ncbi:MAG: sulfur carrier protein ThiS [Candidatus Cyclobacteriaceae bacterium M2_1C_046]